MAGGTHQDNFKAMRTRLLPRLDGAVSGLVQDLSDRGTCSTALWWWSERLRQDSQGESLGGASLVDGWRRATCWRAVAARSGIAVGQTDALAEQPVEPRITPKTSPATVYRTAWAFRSIRFTRLLTAAQLQVNATGGRFVSLCRAVIQSVTGLDRIPQCGRATPGVSSAPGARATSSAFPRVSTRNLPPPRIRTSQRDPAEHPTRRAASAELRHHDAADCALRFRRAQPLRAGLRQ